MLRTPYKESSDPGWGGYIRSFSHVTGAQIDNFDYQEPAYVSRLEMIDSDDNGKYHGAKLCQHYCMTAVKYPGIIEYSQPDKLWRCNAPSANWGYATSGFDWGPVGQPNGGLPSLFYFSSGMINSDKVLTTAEWDSYVDSALASMLPGIKANASIINSLIELKDFKSLPRTLERASSIIDYFGGLLLNRKIPRNRWNKPLRRLIGGASDGYLQWMFNLAPLVRDWFAVANAISNVPKQVKRILAEEGTIQRRHYSRPVSRLVGELQIKESSALPGMEGNRFRFKRYISYPVRHFNAAISFSYELADWEREQALARGLGDALGVNLNPAIIWNAIPWSFVCDWFTNANSWIDRFKVRNIEPRVHVLGFSVSVKVRREILATYQSFGGLRGNTGEIPVARYEEESYHRTPTNPSLEKALELSGLSATQVSLGAALVGSRL